MSVCRVLDNVQCCAPFHLLLLFEVVYWNLHSLLLLLPPAAEVLLDVNSRHLTVIRCIFFKIMFLIRFVKCSTTTLYKRVWTRKERKCN